MSVDPHPNKVQDVYSIQLLDDEDTNNMISEHDPACLGVMQLPNLFKSQMLSSVAQFNTQECITLLVGDPVDHVEKGVETPLNTKSQGLATVQKALQRQVSGYLGGKFKQRVVEYFQALLGIYPGADRTLDGSSVNKCRKYKRSVSFDSRKVGLFFSILSIFGTLILIYLTLRVRQIAVREAFIPA